MHARMALLSLALWGVGCSNPAESYPQAWSLDVSPQAIADEFSDVFVGPGQKERVFARQPVISGERVLREAVAQ